MLSDSERASSIKAPARPVSGADCGGKERVKRDRGEEGQRRAPESSRKAILKRGGEGEIKKEEKNIAPAPIDQPGPQGPLYIYTPLFIHSSAASLLSLSPSRAHPLFLTLPHHIPLLPAPPSLHPSFVDSWLRS